LNIFEVANKEAYLQHNVLSHAQTAPYKEAEAAYVSEAALVTAMPSSAVVTDKPELRVHHGPTKAGCIRCIKKEASVQKSVRESENFLIARQERTK
jgi:hypothetical protein